VGQQKRTIKEVPTAIFSKPRAAGKLVLQHVLTCNSQHLNGGEAHGWLEHLCISQENQQNNGDVSLLCICMLPSEAVKQSLVPQSHRFQPIQKAAVHVLAGDNASWLQDSWEHADSAACKTSAWKQQLPTIYTEFRVGDLCFFLQWKALYSQRLLPANPATFSLCYT
jgi:hypothetical protein